jgi:SAM-dependent methyltransferase
MSWEGIERGFGDAIRRYHQQRGTAADAPRVVTTVRINTELVPKRAQTLLDLVAGATTLETIQGRRVLELGCGFGALAAYLAWSERPSCLVGVDVREEFVAAATEAAAAAGVDIPIEFAVADMRDLTRMTQRQFDLVVINNAFIYLTSARDMDRALAQIHDVLVPGGWLLAYHANKWRLREPFTNDPLMHLLPARAAELVAWRTGWKHNHGRVRLVSPPEMRRRARRAGLTDGRVIGFGPERTADGIKRYFGNFYALAAQRPGGGRGSRTRARTDTSEPNRAVSG